MRILISGMNTAGFIYNFGRGLSELGHEVTTATFSDNKFYDHNFSFTFDQNTFVQQSGGNSLTLSKDFFSFIEKFDLFIFISGLTLLPGMHDLPILHKLGKKIIIRNTGSCTRFIYPSSLAWNHAGAPFNMSIEEFQELVHPKRDWSKASSYSFGLVYAYHLAPKLYKECMSTLYADVVANCSAHSSLGFSPFFAAVNTFDPDGCSPLIPARKKPVIVHAPSREAFKGTSAIEACLEELQSEGLSFEYARPQKIPSKQLQKILRLADIVIDQLACGGHGILANESMACGCAVLGGNSADMSPIPFHRPVIPISRENLKEQIRRVVLDIPFRVRVAEAGIDYVNTVHRPATSASYLLSCLERAKESAFDYYPSLFLDTPFRPDYKQWIDQTKARLYAPDVENAEDALTHRRDEVPEFLQDMFAKALFTSGVHPDTDMDTFVREFGLKNIQTHLLPRWDAAKLTKVNPWLSLGSEAGKGLPCKEYISYAELANP